MAGAWRVKVYTYLRTHSQHVVSVHKPDAMITWIRKGRWEKHIYIRLHKLNIITKAIIKQCRSDVVSATNFTLLGEVLNQYCSDFYAYFFHEVQN